MSKTAKKIPTTKNIYQKKNMSKKATIQSKKSMSKGIHLTTGKPWLDIMKDIKKQTYFLVGYILFYLYFAALIFSYFKAIFYLQDKVLTNSVFLIAFFSIAPCVLWIMSTTQEYFNYYNPKKMNFWLILTSSVFTMMQPLIYLSHRYIASNVMRIAVTDNMSKGMVVSLARLGMSIPLGICTVVIFPPLYKWATSREVKEKLESFKIKHYVDFRKNKQYCYDLRIFRNLETGKQVVIKEEDRFVHGFINGQSGTGKTSSTIIPAVCNDLNQKIINLQKREEELLQMIKAGEAYVAGPFSKVDEYNVRPKKKYIKKYNRIYEKYPDCGMTIMAPNNAMNNTIIDLCEARGLDVNVVDPSKYYKQKHAKAKGLENFYVPLGLPEKERTIRILEQATAFSETLIATNEQNGQGEQYFRDISTSVTVNIAIICMLAANIEGRQTNINEIHHCISNFGELKSKVATIEEEFGIQIQITETTTGKRGSNFSAEDLLEKIKTNEKGVVFGNGKDNPYYSMLVYVKKELLGPGAEKMEDQARGLRNLLDKILMDPRYLKILSTPHENAINFDEMLSKSQITVVNTALEYGAQVSTALGILFLLNLQLAVQRRPEHNRSNHFIWVDEAAQYVHQVYENMYTLYRQYRAGTTLALQTLSQMGKSKSTEYLKNIVLGAGLQILFGRVSAEEMELYSQLAGSVSENIVQKTKMKTSMFMSNANQNESERITTELKNNLEGSQIRMRDFQEISVFRIDQGRVLPGFLGKCNFLDKKELKNQNIMRVNFRKYAKTKKSEVKLTKKGQAFVDGQKAFMDAHKGKISIKTTDLEEKRKKETLEETIELFTPEKIEAYKINDENLVSEDVRKPSIDQQQTKKKPEVNTSIVKTAGWEDTMQEIEERNDSLKGTSGQEEISEQKRELIAEEAAVEEKYIFGNLFSEVLSEEEFLN